MARVALLGTALALVAFSVAPAASGHDRPRASASAFISIPYGKHVIRRYIERNYYVALGPYFGSCWKPAGNKVRCEVQFKAGLYWRCGRVTVRDSGAYDYISARLPIGC